MPLELEQLRDLQSPFYRVAVKALIFDEQKRILVVFNEDGEAELPGGGWEHSETLLECVSREVDEETGAKVTSISEIKFAFQSQSDHGWHVLRLVVQVKIDDYNLKAGDDMVELRFVTKEELQNQNFDLTDAPIIQYIDKIWSES